MERLKWEVYVTPGIPIVTPDRPPGVQGDLFPGHGIGLIYGSDDAVLVDAFLTVEAGQCFGIWVASKR